LLIKPADTRSDAHQEPVAQNEKMLSHDIALSPVLETR
jgi:hypothetical protein